ncbi:MAG: M23 family metallopeptidase [Peptococcaceae bacterium]|nr:M23 family metallopeptidase [Peptococcaceae bacterium]
MQRNDKWEQDWDDELRRGRGRSGRKRRNFSFDFLSKVQKQTVLAVLLLFVVLSAKYSHDAASVLIFKTFQVALAPTNDYSVALNQLTRGIMGVEKTVPAAQTGPDAIMPVQGTVVVKFGIGSSRGVDLAAPLGTVVVAPMAGTVTVVGNDADRGLYVKIDHGAGLVSLLANFAQLEVRQGQKVDKGSALGMLGLTASYKRPWVHWEVWRANTPIDPQSLNILPLSRL